MSLIWRNPARVRVSWRQVDPLAVGSIGSAIAASLTPFATFGSAFTPGKLDFSKPALSGLLALLFEDF